MKRHLAVLAAAVAFSGLLSSNAYALSITDANVVGTIVDAVPFGDAVLTDYVNHLLSMSAPSGPSVYGTETYQRTDIAIGSTSVSLLDSSAPASGDLFIPGGWEYVVAKYDGKNAGAVVLYLGGASYTLEPTSYDIWTNIQNQGYALSGWVAYNTVECTNCLPVPDGGSTVTLLGTALFAFGMVARRFRKN